MNTYAYVGGNPLRYTDILGLEYAEKYAGYGAIAGGSIAAAGSLVADGATMGGNIPFTPAEIAAGSAVGGAIGYGVGSAVDWFVDGGAEAIGDAISDAADATGEAIGDAAEAISDWWCDDAPKEDDLEKVCDERLAIDLVTCEALGRRSGKAAYAICHSQAMERYADCLSERNMNPPGISW